MLTESASDPQSEMNPGLKSKVLEGRERVLHSFSSSVIQHRITVSFEHRLVFTEDVFDPLNLTLLQLFEQNPERTPRVWVVLDQGLVDATPTLLLKIKKYFLEHSKTLSLVDEPMIIAGGEPSKTSLQIHTQLVSALNQLKLCRHSYVLVAGGGAVLDAVCYAASIVHRGIRQIRLPTTVLAQTDAGVGIKNGIDLFGKKNFLGTFQPPDAVINDSTFLKTLSANDWRSGTAEAVKVALIQDAAFFEWIEENAHRLAGRDLLAMKKLIKRGAELHLNHIANSGDPFEKGSARPLDFGHWSAHKLEQLTGFTLTHGNAVAIGIALDCLYAQETGLLSPANTTRVLSCLKTLGFELWNTQLASYDPHSGKLAILQGLEDFREHLGGRLSIPLIRDIGVVVELHQIHEPSLIRALTRLENPVSDHMATV